MPDRPDVPDFAVALRGYDRQQVDDYVSRLTVDLDEAHRRALDAERRLASRPAPTGGGFAELGPHVASVLERAEEEAGEMRRGAELHAEQVRSEAERAAQDLRTLSDREAAHVRAQAEALLEESRSRADELLRRAQQHADTRAEEVIAAAASEAETLRTATAEMRAVHTQALDDARAAARRLLEVTEQQGGTSTQTRSGATRMSPLREASETGPTSAGRR